MRDSRNQILFCSAVAGWEADAPERITVVASWSLRLSQTNQDSSKGLRSSTTSKSSSLTFSSPAVRDSFANRQSHWCPLILQDKDISELHISRWQSWGLTQSPGCGWKEFPSGLCDPTSKIVEWYRNPVLPDAKSQAFKYQTYFYFCLSGTGPAF